MPIYEYRRADGTTFEVLQSMSAEPLTHDPQTGEPVQRVLHAPAVHFKGSGFYNTDYGTRKRNREKEAGDGASANGKDGDASAKKDGGGEKKAAASSSSSSSSSPASSSD